MTTMNAILDPNKNQPKEIKDYWVVFSLRTGRPLFTLTSAPDAIAPERRVIQVQATSPRDAERAAKEMV